MGKIGQCSCTHREEVAKIRPERARHNSPGQSAAPPWVQDAIPKNAALKGQGDGVAAFATIEGEGTLATVQNILFNATFIPNAICLALTGRLVV